MLGYYASNIMEDLVDIIQWNKVDELDKNNSIIVDVREEFELVTGVFENSINIPLGQLRDRLDEIPKNKNVYVTCQVGQRGYVASRILRSNGINAINIDGGIKTYIYVKRSQESIKNQFDNKNEETIKEEVAAMNLDDLDITEINAKVTLDACGLQCPGPIRRVFEEMTKMSEGEVFRSKSKRSWIQQRYKIMV